MKTVTASPNPALPGTLVAVAGSGFPNFRIRLLLDGVGLTTDIFRPRKDGTFAVGRVVSATPKTQTLIAQQQQSSGLWIEAARTSVVVKAAVPPPPPLPPAPTNVTATSGSASATLRWT